MYTFDYHRPSTLEEAEQLFRNAEDGIYLAGGQTLLPTMKQRLAAPSDVVDLAGVDGLSGIEATPERVSVGAFTRHAEVAAHPGVCGTLPALAGLAGCIGDGQVRNRGTLGGSVANSDPAADYPAAVIGLGATVHTGSRQIAADEFFLDLFETALAPGEIITRIDFPVPLRAAYRKFANPASRYAVVGVLVADFGGRIRVGITGAGPCAFRGTALEEALQDDLRPAALEQVEVPDAGFNNDLFASADYRAHLVRVMACRAVEDLMTL
ncbi:MAG: xanthine dehydrogenase family protein subunit M [Gammaproteobacteria bacterium]|nr:xanthine dehydrogenase family protein subunit M [Gammaproteobacteria bacterium]